MGKLNKCFESYKDKHKGMSAALLGNGHTFSKFPKHLDIITVGCNHHVYCADMNLDYYFIGDAEDKRKGYNADKSFYHDYFSSIHTDNNFIRVNGGTQNTSRCASVDKGLDNCTYYNINREFDRHSKLSTDPTTDMAVGCSIIFEMLQFILYTGIKRLYIIGCDCTIDKGGFHSPVTRFPNPRDSISMADHYWVHAARFIELNYPNVEVRIINPVRMKQFKECTYSEVVENG